MFNIVLFFFVFSRHQFWTVYYFFAIIKHYAQCAQSGQAPKYDIGQLLLKGFCYFFVSKKYLLA